ncbi:MAG: S8 family serine peptidase [Flavobacteriales bacterium]|nr:S8 family serine peptidase [Flavobacteriales bacterium]
MRNLIAFLLSSFVISISAQTGPDTYWVQFTDKDATPFTVGEPQEFLSARSIMRRQDQGIAIGPSDLPVAPAYISAVLATGEVQLINRSKWFNAVTIRTSDIDALDAIGQLPFVSSIRTTRRLFLPPQPLEKFTLEAPPPMVSRGGQPEDYGWSWTQISMLNGHELHALDAKGQGMLIGVLDSGFEDTDSLAAFADLRAREGIVLTRDMVNHDGDVYDDHWHGRSVLSCMTGVLPGYLQGTAPLADYALVRTEEVAFEMPVEEDNWIAGAELLDSLGCDVLNTSLGYTTYDDSLLSHTYPELDGATTRISIAAGMAAQKGMIPVQSAGNNGWSAWHHISAPADAFDILAVGAVGENELHAGFSAFGPSADGRVKPDVMAMGAGAIGLRLEGDSVAAINGTSFSSPILAGLVACLWQLHPQRTAHDVMDAVRRSAHLYLTPNDSMGYGIPDFMQAHAWLTLTTTVSESEFASGSLAYPVPFEDQLALVVPGMADGIATLRILDASGRSSVQRGAMVVNGTLHVGSLEALPPGLWFFQVSVNGATRTVRAVK